ncbi:MAG: ribonuclease HII [Bacilli bacterium]|nr:ribonuclease HII [Bacilli bacterium]
MIDLYKYEKELIDNGINYIGGVDEAGRGPLFGPVVASCVVLPLDFVLDGLNDSKKLSEKKRNEYFDYIKKHALACEVGIVDAKKIDEINIYQASRLAMTIAINKVKTKIKLEYILSDAMPIDLDIPVMPIIKGDAKSITIAAASVIAKVTRDKMMYELDGKYPEYGFKNHKGYPTKKHLEALHEYGLIDGYRKTYGPVKDLIENK